MADKEPLHIWGELNLDSTSQEVNTFQFKINYKISFKIRATFNQIEADDIFAQPVHPEHWSNNAVVNRANQYYPSEETETESDLSQTEISEEENTKSEPDIAEPKFRAGASNAKHVENRGRQVTRIRAEEDAGNSREDNNNDIKEDEGKKSHTKEEVPAKEKSKGKIERNLL
jgi:hypothetical protein